MTDQLVARDRADLRKPKILDAFAAFLRLNVADGDASPQTVRAYHSRVSIYVAWCDAEGIDPATATEQDLEEYRRHLVDAGYSRATISSQLSTVRQFYQAAVWRGLRPDNPAEGLNAPKDRTEEAESVKFLPLEGLRRLLASPDGSRKGKRDRAILALMGYHGLRVAEVAALTYDDYRTGSPSWLTVTGKGAKGRQVYLTQRTTEILEAWLAVREAAPGVREVFVTLDNHTPGQPISTRSLRRVVDAYLEEAGLKEAGISCHSLRHSFATWSLFGGAKLLSISQALGHSSVETTQVYAKVVDRIRENPTKYLEELMG